MVVFTDRIFAIVIKSQRIPYQNYFFENLPHIELSSKNQTINETALLLVADELAQQMKVLC